MFTIEVIIWTVFCREYVHCQISVYLFLWQSASLIKRYRLLLLPISATRRSCVSRSLRRMWSSWSRNTRWRWSRRTQRHCHKTCRLNATQSSLKVWIFRFCHFWKAENIYALTWHNVLTSSTKYDWCSLYKVGVNCRFMKSHFVHTWQIDHV